MKNRKFLLIVFCLVFVGVLSLTIAYATLSATLTINGGADVVAATWDVHFENAVIVNKLSNDSLYDYEVSNMAVWGCVPQAGIDCIAKDSNLKIDFSTSSILVPGDFRSFTVDVVNAGSIDAKLDSFILNGLNSEQEQYLNYYVKYDDGTEVKVGDILSVGSRKKLLIVIEFDKDVIEEHLPTTDQTISLSYIMNYVQGD